MAVPREFREIPDVRIQEWQILQRPQLYCEAEIATCNRAHSMSLMGSTVRWFALPVRRLANVATRDV
jgi:hypothetical protein